MVDVKHLVLKTKFLNESTSFYFEFVFELKFKFNFVSQNDPPSIDHQNVLQLTTANCTALVMVNET